MNAYILLAFAIAAEVVGTMALGRSDGFSRPVASAVVVVCYLTAFYLLSQVLQQGMPVAVAYAVWSAVGIVTVAALGAVFLDEGLSLVQVGGIALIVAGVMALELGTSW